MVTLALRMYMELFLQQKQSQKQTNDESLLFGDRLVGSTFISARSNHMNGLQDRPSAKAGQQSEKSLALINAFSVVQ